LIIVDDLLYTSEWDTIIKEFCKIKRAKSWTIVITTRQKDIAEHCCKKLECIHMLNILGAEEARELFIKTVMKKTYIQFISFDIMLCISITVLKLARDSLEYFVGKI
jgi:ABC-type methionine transport system ATPase subunit